MSSVHGSIYRHDCFGLWLPGRSLYEMHCMTLIQGLAPDEFLRWLGAEPQGEIEGFGALAERDFEFQEDQEEMA
jgi:hypothetical protein